MQEIIKNTLGDLEKEYEIKILYACESGSRAWGFASPDSDYDIRFIYCHPKDWYLKLFPQKDVIDRMLPMEQDVGGWDLRKTLQLFAKSNIALFEWLNSPIIYKNDDSFLNEISGLIPLFFNPKKGMFHYFSMAANTYEQHLKDEQVKLKKLFYFIRPILACEWIWKNHTMPPTDFHEIYDSDITTDFEKDFIKDLLKKKEIAKEGELIEVPEELRVWMNKKMALNKQRAEEIAPQEKADTSLLDKLFLKAIRSS